MAASSSSSGGYDVFLNFRGQDTRRIFVGHLNRALQEKTLVTFLDSSKLNKGDEISDVLNAIEKSRLCIVVLSENYAFSSWCLKELVKIVECMATKKQMVVPIFYDVDPADVRYQRRSFAEAIAKHEDQSRVSMEELQRWRSALTTVACLSGWNSSNYEDDGMLIQEIVQDTFKKLIDISSSKADGLVGIDSHIEEMKLRLRPRLNDVHVVGIWGMGGIGKTTIARAVYDEISCQFARSCFLYNVKKGFTEKDESQMQEEFLFKILKEKEQSVGILDKGFKMIMERLRNEKVLVVLDDVENFFQIEALLGGDLHAFGGGSRIIITTRDKKSLSGVGDLYEPRHLSDDDARELFMKYAFRTNQPTQEYNHLIRRAIRYAQGLPLALKIFGASLDNKSVHEWKCVLDKVKRIPHKGIQDILITSLDGLDALEKAIFLDVACFFIGQRKEVVTKFLDGFGFFSSSGLRVLVDRALITISEDNTLDMHDLLQEMGREIVCLQSNEEPGGRSRLWSYEDVHHVLTSNTATEAVECIKLEWSEIVHPQFVAYDVFDEATEVDRCINAEAFVRMMKLRMLIICDYFSSVMNDHDSHIGSDIEHKDAYTHSVRGELKFLSHQLRFLIWHKCPLKSLPSNFNPKELVRLDMRRSSIQYLWEGTKHMKKLEVINLSRCERLLKIDDLTGATNLEKLFLNNCSSLTEVHPSIFALQNLVVLNLRGCKELKILPSLIHMKSLKTLDLSDCSYLEKIPEISGIMKELSKLYLDNSAIKELPSSIVNLQGLEEVSMRNCRSLVSLPDNICYLAYLKKLNLEFCSKLQNLPQNFGNLESLREFNVEGSGIKQFPFSILGLNKLSTLSCHGCKEMVAPFSAWPSTFEYYCSYSGLRDLDLSDCNMMELSDGIAHLSSLKRLKLCRNNLESLPATMNRLGLLTDLKLEACKRLESIPVLSSSIEFIDAHDCTALKSVSTPKAPYSKNLCFRFSNCSQLIQTNLFTDIVETHSRYQVNPLQSLFFEMSLLRSKIPDWFDHQCGGSSVTAQLPWKLFDNKFLGFAVCGVSNFKGARINASGLRAKCYCTFKGNHGVYSSSFDLLKWSYERNPRFLQSDHMFLCHEPWSEHRLIEKEEQVNERYYTEVMCKIVIESTDHKGVVQDVQQHRIRRCGVRFFYASHEEEVQNMSMTGTKSRLDSYVVAHQDFGQPSVEVPNAKRSHEWCRCCYNEGEDTADELEPYPKRLELLDGTKANSRKDFSEPSGGDTSCEGCCHIEGGNTSDEEQYPKTFEAVNRSNASPGEYFSEHSGGDTSDEEQYPKTFEVVNGANASPGEC